MTQARQPRLNELDLAASAQLAQLDPHLGRWIHKIGALKLPRRQKFSLVDALARAILSQQLNGKAAATITERLQHLASETLFSAGTLSRLSDAELRGVGVSCNKAKALKSLAEHALGGLLPDTRTLGKMCNQDIIDAITPVRGIGRWTVEMLLIFRLGRHDVLPADDFGVRRGAQIALALDAMPSAKLLSEIGMQKWAPQLSLATLYCWKIADLAKLPIEAK